MNPPAPPAPKKKPRAETETPAAPEAAAIQPAGPTESGSRTLTRALGLKIGRIVIDPGHGGHDTGTIGPTGLEEKNVVLDVGLRLKKLLEHSTGCEVIMTRDDDTFIPLEERTAIANEKSADLFISIHANASRDMSARGIETYYLNLSSNPDVLEVAARENATSQESVHQLQDLIKKIAMTEKIEESEDFAKQVQREVYTRVTKVSGAQRDRGVKKAPFVVLIGANMPSVLAEISFLTNPRDERMLKRPDYREKIASALYDGILQYVKNLGEVKTVQRAAETSPPAHPDF
jgi:N-acetylmuramoyl-L-alanine amidase